MAELPIRRMVMYKHGVGYFERRGVVTGTSLRLSFPREAMDDILKSLVALDMGSGQVRGIDFETPEDRMARLAKGSIHLSDGRSLLDLLRDLRGRRVRVTVEGSQLEGTVIGIDMDEERPLHTPLLTLALADGRTVRSFAVRMISQVELLDERAAADLAYFLRASQSEEDRRSATLHLSDGEHDLLVGYVAPAPAWRVSYRLLFEPASSDSSAGQSAVLLQGWGLFDNQLDEDLENVVLTLVAGMPVSFRYRLYEPHTPERPLVQDEERTVAAPITYSAMAGAPPPAPAAMAAPAPMAKRMRAGMALAADADMPEFERMELSTVAQSTSAAAGGEERGALFQYQVTHPVSVARGQSAMVPIVVSRLDGRKELLYNSAKLPKHPVASLRVNNATGLTLERGPATVLEQGDYAGEAVLPFTRPGGELIVPYAVELGINIREEPASTRVMSSIRLHEGYLLVQEWDIQTLTYRIHNTLAKPADVTIEQALLPNYELHETEPPTEQGQGQGRWRVTCAPAAETTITIRQRRQYARREEVRGVGSKRLQEFFKNRFLDEATYKALEDVLAIYADIEQRRERLNQIEQERQRIYKRQQQTQSSLGPLGREGEEGKLRSRYVQQLNELENQLNAFTSEEQRINSDIAKLEQQADKRLQELSK